VCSSFSEDWEMRSVTLILYVFVGMLFTRVVWRMKCRHIF